MGLPQKLLDKLACPKCHGDLDYDKHKSRFECSHCREFYRVEDDIPVMPLDEAQKID
ncbi:MAG: Trm112 family protein [bacterium]|nr:Trm112 family protein [bacterium]